jgi:hypothetical protein
VIGPERARRGRAEEGRLSPATTMRRAAGTYPPRFPPPPRMPTAQAAVPDGPLNRLLGNIRRRPSAFESGYNRPTIDRAFASAARSGLLSCSSGGMSIAPFDANAFAWHRSAAFAQAISFVREPPCRLLHSQTPYPAWHPECRNRRFPMQPRPGPTPSLERAPLPYRLRRTSRPRTGDAR